MTRNCQIFLASFRTFIQENPFGLFSDFTLYAGFENKNLLMSKEDSRRLIRTVSMKSVEGGIRIIHIWLPEYFNLISANAILKVLEEPPPNTIYLLVTYAYESLLTTITSRVLFVRCTPFFQMSRSGEYLVNNGLNASKAAQLSRLSNGSLGEVLHLDTDRDQIVYEEFRQWMLDCLDNKFSDLIKRSEDFARIGKLSQRSSLHNLH